LGLISGLVVYILLWWWVLFMVLPFKVQVPNEPLFGHATSAPENPFILIKLLITTVISSLLWVITYYIISMDLINFIK
jgi:predicted secreted protein